MIFSALLNCNKSTPMEAIQLIIKSTFIYCKLMNNSQNKIFIYEEFKKKSGVFSFLLEVEFWKEWLKTEFKETENIVSKSDNNMIYLKILLNLAKKMKELNIDFKNISRIIIESLANEYLSDVSLCLIYY